MQGTQYATKRSILCRGAFCGPTMHTLVSVLWCILCFQRIFLRNIFDFTTAGDWDCVAAVERLQCRFYLFSCPFGPSVSLWNFETIRDSLMMPKGPKLASLAQKICTL